MIVASLFSTWFSTWAAAAPAWLIPSLNHLWQSTLFALAAWGVTVCLKNNRAEVRHWVWLAASLKFFIPFSLLVAAGGHLGWPVTQAARSQAFLEIIQPLSQPASATHTGSAALQPGVDHAGQLASQGMPWLLGAVWLGGCLVVVLGWGVRWRRVAAIVRSAEPLTEGRQRQALDRIERASGVRTNLRLLSGRGCLEPGVFGILRPALVLPAGIADRLGDAQLEALFAHELCHVRRRDNLIAAIHMVVQAVFWFHPLVWWMGARMVEERESACDEAVLEFGSEPQIYAESILQVCKFYLESPLVCVSGITGADLKKRVEHIMTNRMTLKLDLSRRVLLSIAGFAAVAGPVAAGLAAPQNQAQPQDQKSAGTEASATFEAASIKPTKESDDRSSILRSPGGRFTTEGATLRNLIRLAYHVQDHQITGGPSWLTSTRYNIEATSSLPNATDEQFRAMVRALLAERFQLKLHRASKEMPFYALVVGKNGPKIHAVELKESDHQRGIRGDRGELTLLKASISMLAEVLSNQVGLTILDKTGLKGLYDCELKWTPDQNQAAGPKDAIGAPPAGDADGPSLFTAIQEQLGLKLEAQKGPVEVLVIDSAEKASEN